MAAKKNTDIEASKKELVANSLKPSPNKFSELTQGKYEELLTGCIQSGLVGIYASGADKGKRFINCREDLLVAVFNQLWPDNKLTVGGPSLPDPRKL